MWTQLLDRALKTARRLTKDPEGESIAGEAVLKAVETHDSKKGDLEAWVVLITRRMIGDYFRSRYCRPVQLMGEDLPEPACEDETSETHPDWQLLVERYIDGVAEWSLARRYGVSTYEMHRRINAAKARFLEFMGV